MADFMSQTADKLSLFLLGFEINSPLPRVQTQLFRYYRTPNRDKDIGFFPDKLYL